MILPYSMRLLCLCFATFFVVHALSWLVVRSFSSAAVRIAETMRPRMSSRFLFGLRMAPVAVTLFLVLGFCVPSYVWLEPDVSNERVGLACLLAAALGMFLWTASLVRGLASIVRTERYMRRFDPVALGAGESDSDVVVVNRCTAMMAVTGVLHPRLLV